MKTESASLPLEETITLTNAINSNPGNTPVSAPQVAAFVGTLNPQKGTLSDAVSLLILETKFNDKLAVKSSHVLGEESFNLH